MKKTVMALGFFDGVHIGHTKILKTAVLYAAQNGLSSAACTFLEHPRTLVAREAPKMLCTTEKRIELIGEQGIEKTIALPFTRETAGLSPREFAERLVERYGCAVAVCGENYRFGKGAAGRPADLEAFGIKPVVCEHVRLHGETVSSTLIRRLLAEGDIAAANECLGRPYSIDGSVTEGFGIGRKLGFPTVNLLPDAGILVPMDGVYASSVTVAGRTYAAVTNIGTRPTFGNGGLSIESHVIGFDGDLYGEKISVSFTARLRDERRFAAADELASQIGQDIREAARLWGEQA